MLITNEYREQNRALHQSTPSYGTSSSKWASQIMDTARAYKVLSILDYGCGKGHLKEVLGGIVAEYDPAIEGKDAPPTPADMVACTDVLEHIEPECLDAVLADLRRLTGRVAFLTIESRPARKTLPDGRNAHLIQEPAIWWLNKLTAHGFDLRGFQNLGTTFVVLVK